MPRNSSINPDDELFWIPDVGSDTPKEHFRHVAGTRYPTEQDLGPLIRPASNSARATSIPYVSPIVRRPDGHLVVLYKRLLTFDDRLRDAHVAVWGASGGGKTTQVGQPLINADLEDADRLVIVLGLKRENYGWIGLKCRDMGTPLHYIDLNDPARSLGFNPLATRSADEAYDIIARFTSATVNANSHDSEFWGQAGSTLLMALWDCGARSFPAMLNELESGTTPLLARLRGGESSACRAAASFLAGGSHNSDTVMATISGWLHPFRNQAVATTTSSHELDGLGLFEAGRQVVYIHCDEARLTTLRPIYSLLLQWFFQRIIEHADDLAPGRSPHPTSVHIEDLPAFGNIRTLPDQLNTLRSRRCTVTVAIQSSAALAHAYGAATAQLVASAFATRIVLPGINTDDARMFSAGTGDRVVEIAGDGGRRGHILTVPLLSAAEIRSPECSHFMWGRPATILTPELAFQAYLAPMYRRPDTLSLLGRATRTDSKGPLRARPLRAVRKRVRRIGDVAAAYLPPVDLSPSLLRERIERERKRIGWKDTSAMDKDWWEGMEATNQHRLLMVDRLIHELVRREATIGEFAIAYREARTDNVQVALAYLDFLRVKRAEEKRAG